MNELGNTPAPTTDNNREQIESLRYQMNLLFGALLVVSITLTLFLGLQARRASLDFLALQGPAEESVKAARQEDMAVRTAFEKLQEFARTHPDFDKVVLSKYHVNTNSAAAGSAKK